MTASKHNHTAHKITTTLTGDPVAGTTITKLPFPYSLKTARETAVIIWAYSLYSKE